jgi:hypothetical protein
MDAMKRFSIPVPIELEERIVRLRKTDRFCRESFSKIVVSCKGKCDSSGRFVRTAAEIEKPTQKSI